MQPETLSHPLPDADSLLPIKEADQPGVSNGMRRRICSNSTGIVRQLTTSLVADRKQSVSKPATGQNGATGQFPPPKTDKPRPHVCTTCGRSFARLEHLKRHERSHTKEKPFECPECTRCFARRDLLLRHQQKLHLTGATNSRPRNGRRESVSGASSSGPTKVRKNSVANAAVGSIATARPRANTISHIDFSSLGLLDGTEQANSRLNALGINTNHGMGHSHSASMSAPFGYHGLHASSGHGNPHDLPKLDVGVANDHDMTNSLRTAPPMASFAAATGFDLDELFSPGTTVNPAQLHFGNSSAPMNGNFSQSVGYEGFANQHPAIPEGDDFGWMRNWNMQLQDAAQGNNDQAIDDSSPSRISSGDSPGNHSDSINNSTPAMPMQNFQWDLPNQTPLSAGPFQLDALGNGLPNIEAPLDTVSPSNLHDATPTGEQFYPQLMGQQSSQHLQPHQQQPHDVSHGQPANFFGPALSTFSSVSPSISSSSMTGSARQSSVTSASTDSITDATRQALLSTLSQPSVFGGHNHRKYSQPTISSPLSPSANGTARGSFQGPNLPSTADIRRYVDAFIQYAHPHLPVCHIPTLSFDADDFTRCLGIKGTASQGQGITGGGGCLILAMAAIGALYEYEHPASKELFEAAKKMISLYLEERRKADMSAAVNGSHSGSDVSARDTPLWLVQAMLLNVIYGHQCGDRTAADIASNHCAALVSLARAADLAQPPNPSGAGRFNAADVDMSDTNGVGHAAKVPETNLQAQWFDFIVVEKRKRLLFCIFILSSLLTTAYNQTPTIMNSEILLDLPCDEELWAAENAQEWHNRGGLAAVQQNSVSFAAALSTLLTANQRQNGNFASSSYNANNPLAALQAGDAFPESELRPSTFGCLVLINALHNYIWETRSRHHGRQWTPQETESMFSHIEPALNAWQAAWKANDRHKLERPNPFGLGPLSADSIPLLDLAFVRLFVNLGRSKEAFWARDFDTMADELARGAEIVQHAEVAPNGAENPTTVKDIRRGSISSPENGAIAQRRASQALATEHASNRRERHLRKAAFYAADSLTIACNFNLTYADVTAHELPIQSAMCFFDCSQVLAEWAATVQERVGRYLGVLGRGQIDYSQVPAIMLLESEDIELLRKIERITESLEAKRFQQENLLAMDLHNMHSSMSMSSVHNNVDLSNCGLGSRFLRVVAVMLEKAVVWPGKSLEQHFCRPNILTIIK